VAGLTVANAQLSDRQLHDVCRADERTLSALDGVLDRHHQSGRGRVRLLRLARTLADLEQRDTIREDDVLEAAALRGFAALSDA
jgi:magnesium chelatase family protein